VGSARALERLCSHHAAYRWLCGGVPVNHDMLSAFRRDGGALLDAVLTHSLTGLIAEGLVGLEEVAIDGTKVRSLAGHSSMAGLDRLARIETLVVERIAGLKQDLDEHAGSAERIKGALDRLVELEVEKAGARKRTGAKPSASRWCRCGTSRCAGCG
jgi:hypothetical protein